MIYFYFQVNIDVLSSVFVALDAIW